MKKKFNAIINKKAFIFIIGLIILVILGYGYENNLFSLHFVDEEYNFTLAKFFLNGLVIYKDTFSNHQPLAFIISAFIQKISSPESIYSLVKRHREFMIIYSFSWSLFLIYRFKLPALIFTAIYEPVKFFYFGHLFLPESLVVNPLIFLVLSIKEKGSRLNYFFIGLNLGFIIFLLAPFWPLCLFLLAIILRGSKIKKVIPVLLGFGVIFAASFYFTDFNGYLRQAIYINYKYFIPLTSTEPAWEQILKALFSPIIVLISSGDSRLWLLKGLSLLFLINAILLVKSKRYSLFALSAIILFLSDLRFVDPSKEYYQGFHQLPWIGLLTFLTVWLTLINIKRFPKFQIVFSSCLIFLIIFSWIISGPSLFTKRNKVADLDINYSSQNTLGEVVRIMSLNSKHDSLFVAPDEWLIYWQSGLHPPSSINSYYGWMDFVPSLKSEVDSTFATNLPTYLYCNCSQESITKYENFYVRLKKDGSLTNLYVLPGKIESLTVEQKNKIRYFKFEI